MDNEISKTEYFEEEEALFADRHLHPTDKGFDFYYKALAAELEKYL